MTEAKYDLRQYPAEVFRTFSGTERDACTLLGLLGESGEVSDVIKKHVCHRVPLDKLKLAKELGDVLWYAVAKASTVLTSMTVNTYLLTSGGYDPAKNTTTWVALAEGLCRDSATLARASYPFEAMDAFHGVLAYLRAFAESIDLSLAQVAEMNVNKLRARYPEGFSTAASVAKADEQVDDLRKIYELGVGFDANGSVVES